MKRRYFMYDDAVERCSSVLRLLEETVQKKRRFDRRITAAEKAEELKWIKKRNDRLEKAFDYMLNSQLFPPPVIVDHQLLIGFHIGECTYDFGRHSLTYAPNILAKTVGYSGIREVEEHHRRHSQPSPSNMRELDEAPFIYQAVTEQLVQAQTLIITAPANPSHIDSPTVLRRQLTSI